MKYLSDRKGMVLILVLLVLAILIAMVTEFSYRVFTTTSSLYNWYDGRRLSELSDSGIDLAKGFLKENTATLDYTYPEKILLPVPLMNTEDSLTLEIIDEQGRFNINSIIYRNGNDNEKAMTILKRLFNLLDIDNSFVDNIADWIDPDSEPRRAGSETGAKNAPLYTVSELIYINGLDNDAFKTIEPYVTVYGDDYGGININTANKITIMSLSDRINEPLAERLILYRERSPFRSVHEIKDVPGFSDITSDIGGKYTVKSSYFRIRAEASFRRVKRITESVIDIKEEPKVIFYKER